MTEAGWFILRDENEIGPLSEVEMRHQLVNQGTKGTRVRQGNSDWVEARVVLEKFKELARSGFYLRRGGVETGPFTPSKALEMIRANPKGEVRQGRKGLWISARAFLASQNPTTPTKRDDSSSVQQRNSNQQRDSADDLLPVESSEPESGPPGTRATSSPGSAQTGHGGAAAASGSAASATSDSREIAVACPHCRKSLLLPIHAAGKRGRCPTCRETFAVPPVGTPSVKIVHAAAGIQRPTQPSSKPPAGPGMQPLTPVRTAPVPTTPVPSNVPAATTASSDGFFDQVAAHGVRPPSRPMPSTNPYASPAQVGPGPPVRAAGGSERQVRYIIPGIFMILLGVGWLLRFIAGVVQIVAAGVGFFAAPPGEREIDSSILLTVFGIAIANLLIFAPVAWIFLQGGFALVFRKRQQMTMARLASILMIVPFCGLCFFPLGIWATVSMYSDYVDQDFR